MSNTIEEPQTGLFFQNPLGVCVRERVCVCVSSFTGINPGKKEGCLLLLFIGRSKGDPL